MTASFGAAASNALPVPPLVGERLRRMAFERPDKPLYTHLLFGDAPPTCLTREMVWRDARALAGMLSAHGLRQQPVLLIYEAGPDFSIAFLGCLLAGVIAAPVPVPQFASHFDRLGRIMADCTPHAILSTGEMQAKLLGRLPADAPLRACLWIATDGNDPTSSIEPAPVAASDIALLQYTSGSTSEPKGVVLTQANIAHNLDMLAEAFQPRPAARIVSWLPHFHDMGLVTGILAPMTCDGDSILMSPRAFLQRPLRWLQAISDYGAEISGAPNFAYELCARWADRGERPLLDLSSWRSAFAGAEPIRMATLEAFADRFAAEGFARTSLTPCYGMAEATLLVTCKPAGALPTTYRLARQAAQHGRAEPTQDQGGLNLTGCGFPPTGTILRIVDPDTGKILPNGRIGEAWVAGPQMAGSYWTRREDHDPFGAMLDGEAAGRWMRTGDLGFVSEAGEFVFMDRLKDVLIVNGQNYACHDLELTAAASHSLLGADGIVAVSHDGDGSTHLAIIAELPSHAVDGTEQVVSSIRASLFSNYALVANTIVFVPPRKISRTTSGKLQRRLTAQRLGDGSLRSLAHYGEPLPTYLIPITGDDRSS